jgi:hypothetical protein
LEIAMCHLRAYEYERPSVAPTRSFFQALRDLLRRAPRPQVEAEVIALPTEVARRLSEPTTDRAKAA